MPLFDLRSHNSSSSRLNRRPYSFNHRLSTAPSLKRTELLESMSARPCDKFQQTTAPQEPDSRQSATLLQFNMLRVLVQLVLMATRAFIQKHLLAAVVFSSVPRDPMLLALPVSTIRDEATFTLKSLARLQIAAGAFSWTRMEFLYEMEHQIQTQLPSPI